MPRLPAELLGVAKTESLRSLREQARDRRVRAIDPEELHRMQHAAMGARHGRTRLGNVTITVELPPEYGLPITTRLDAETDRLWQHWRRQRNGTSSCDGTLPVELFHDDGSAVTAARRRSALGARAFLRMLETGGKGKAHLKALLHDGTDIHTIAHFGRRYPAVLRTALMLGAPPGF